MNRKCLITLLGLALAILPARAATYIVTNNADSGPGTLRQAILDANANPGADTITFAPSLNGQKILLTSGQLGISNSVTILGPGPNHLAIDGNHSSGVFYLAPGLTNVIAGLTITNGFAPGPYPNNDGGGIDNDHSVLTVSNVTVSGNSATANGGGICNNGSSSGSAKLTVLNSTLSGNSTATNGGGIYNNGENSGTASLTVRNGTLTGNSASSGDGGAICNDGKSGSATSTVQNSTLSDNSASSSAGGGILNGGSESGSATLTVLNSTLSTNSAPIGGGIANDGTVSGSATLTLLNSTLSGNSASFFGGGIFNAGSSGTATLTMVDTLLAKGASGANLYNVSGTVTNSSFNLSDENIGGFATTVADLKLGPLADNGGPTLTMALLPGSPAIDAGTNYPGLPATDQRGYGPRIVNGTVDIGAYESGAVAPETPSLVVTTTNDVVDPFDGRTSLREAAAYANSLGGPNTITFAPALSGQTILLTNGEITLSAMVTIDGSALTNGVQINANWHSRLFTVNSGATVVLNALTLTNGYLFGSNGGAISNNGTLTINRCALVGNGLGGAITSPELGGAIYNLGTLMLSNSTVAGNVTGAHTGNYGGNGGGIYNAGTLAAVNCTLANNTAIQNGSLVLNGLGGGIYNAGTLNLANTIVANNSADMGDPDVSGSVASEGYNLIGNPDSSSGWVATDLLNRNPNLGPLQNNGGPTPTMALLAGSPAIDAGNNALAAGLTTDQRGYGPRIVNGTVDIGAYESGAVPAETPSLVVTTTNDVVDPFDGQTSLREALAYAVTLSGPQTITFADSTAGGAVNFYDGGAHVIPLSGTQLAVNSSVTILGPGADHLAIDGGGSSRVFYLAPGLTNVIAGLTITNGYASGFFPNNSGAAIYNDHAVLTISNVTLIGNSADNSGGGIYNFGESSGNATLTVLNSTVSGNSAGNGGGGIFNDGAFSGSATLTVLDSTLSTNSVTGADDGGGIENDAQDFGSATLTVLNSTLSGNSAGNGGGIENNGPLSGNATLMVRNSTVSGNSAGQGGGIFNYGDGGTATLTMVDTLLAKGTKGANYASNSGTVTNSSFNLSDDDSTTAFATTAADLKLGPLADNGGPTLTMALLPGSPAINAGTNYGSLPATDQRGPGYPRVVGGTVDIGAYEFTETPSLVVTTTNDVVDPTDGQTSLREAAAYANSLGGANTITFAPALSGQIILLTNGEITLSAMVTIDGSALPNGVQINGNWQSRIFTVNNNATVILNALTLTNGYVFGGNGGAISNSGSLTINRCALLGNELGAAVTGELGGAIYNHGTLTVMDSTLAGNTAGAHSVTSGGNGGGIFNDFGGTLTMINCTLANNTAVQTNASGGLGGGIYNVGTLNLTNSIVCGNTAASGSPNVYSGSAAAANNLVDTDARLGPLQNNGGPTPTFALLPGSPAINAGNNAAAAALAYDQRGPGYRRVVGGTVDIGAFELQLVAPDQTYTRGWGLSLKIPIAEVLSNCSDTDGDPLTLASLGTSATGATISTNSGVIIYLPAINNNASDSFSYTIDDGHGSEAAGTIHIQVVNLGGLAQSVSTSGGAVTVNFAGIPGFSYDIERSTNLVDWVKIWTTNAPANGLFNFTDSSPPTPAAYYRLQEHVPSG